MPGFHYVSVPSLPRLAWLAARDYADAPFVVLHGPDVEVRPRFFIQGAWDGEFEDGRIDAAEAVFGSGGVSLADRAVFVSPTPTSGALFRTEDEAALAVSNSLALLLAFTGDGLDISRTDYAAINGSILAGFRDYRPQLPTAAGRNVLRVLHCNVVVEGGVVRHVEKPAGRPFTGYEDYVDHLRRGVRAVLDNARASTRDRPMHVFSTQSTGYDSTAVNALAGADALDRVFTVREAKEHRSHYGIGKPPGVSDDGTSIGRCLGFECEGIDRQALGRAIPKEHYYWAGMDNNADFNLHQVSAHVRQPSLLITGDYGLVWDTSVMRSAKGGSEPDDSLPRNDRSMCGLTEWGPVAGLVLAPIPYIGARQMASIAALSDSPEMAPWRLGGSYDKPIARRIAEDAGVPRETFGQRKLASVVDTARPNLPFYPPLRQEFIDHLVDAGLLRRSWLPLLPLTQRWNSYLFWYKPLTRSQGPPLHRALHHGARLYRAVTGRQLPIWPLLTRMDSYLFAFCVNRVAGEYRGLIPTPGDMQADAQENAFPQRWSDANGRLPA